MRSHSLILITLFLGVLKGLHNVNCMYIEINNINLPVHSFSMQSDSFNKNIFKNLLSLT